eukprot:86789_1
MTFANDLQTQSGTAPLTYIFYASADTFTDSSCTRYPRICKYPLITGGNQWLDVSLELDTLGDKIYFDITLWNNSIQWFGVGLGPMDTKGYGIMATNTPAPIGGLVKEFVLNSHTNPSPAPTSVTADTTQNLTN